MFSHACILLRFSSSKIPKTIGEPPRNPHDHKLAAFMKCCKDKAIVQSSDSKKWSLNAKGTYRVFEKSHGAAIEHKNLILKIVFEKISNYYICFLPN